MIVILQVPFIDTPRSFNWRKVEIGDSVETFIHETSINDTRIDLRENIYNFLNQDAFTKDTVAIKVNCLMYYRIVDVKKAIYEIDDLTQAVSNVSQTTIKEVFGQMTFLEALVSQKRINEFMKRGFAPRFLEWGLQVERMELLDIKPDISISTSMTKNMVAERNRRGQFIISEGEKASTRIKSEGYKASTVTIGIGQQEATRKKSEADSQVKYELARAESAAMEAVSSALENDGVTHTEYLLAMKCIDLYRKLSHTPCPKSIIFPYDISGFSQIFSKLPNVFGTNRPKNPPKPKIQRKPDNHDDLD